MILVVARRRFRSTNGAHVTVPLSSRRGQLYEILLDNSDLARPASIRNRVRGSGNLINGVSILETVQPSPFGRALEYNVAGEFLVFPTEVYTSASAGTIIILAKSGSGTAKYLLSQNVTGVNYALDVSYSLPSTGYTFRINNGGTPVTVSNRPIGGFSWTADTWRLLGFDWGQVGMRIFVNGMLDQSNPTKVTTFPTGAQQFYVNQFVSTFGDTNVSYLAMWNRQLSAAEHRRFQLQRRRVA